MLRDAASDAAAATPRTSSPNTPPRDVAVTPMPPEPSPPRVVAPVSPPVPPAPPAPALQHLTPTTVTASSFISNGRDQYAPERAFDGNPATTWTEAARGPGDGEWLQATFAAPQRVHRVRVTPGWNHTSPRGEDLFIANSHLRRVRLVLGPNTTVERDIGADEREVTFDGLDVTTAAVRIETVTVWPGARWPDLCISEVIIEGEPSAPAAGAAPVDTAGVNARTPPPCVAGCIRVHRPAYERCTHDCIRDGTRGAECVQGCSLDYDHCLNDECHFDADGTPWFRPELPVSGPTTDAGTCTYATRDAFHLRASPTARRAGAAEITSNPVVELLHAERLRRGSEQMFRVRLPDGREGWMFVPEAEVPAGCER